MTSDLQSGARLGPAARFGAALALALLATTVPAAAAESQLIIRDVRVFDARSERLRERAEIVIRGTRIEGLIEGPRIFPAGAIVSQTSGHGDSRQRTSAARRSSGQHDALERLGYGLIADGADEVAGAGREQLRQGATQIKLAAGGGISSAFDPIDSVQCFDSKLRAAVQAAADWGTYVAVHAYTPTAIGDADPAGAAREIGAGVERPRADDELVRKHGAHDG